MIVIPAIDLRGGRCVRLRQGDQNEQTVYAEDPAALAERLVNEGAGFIHLVDLDGAFTGKSGNLTAVQAIRRRVKARLQLGGGIRDLGTIIRLLSLGIDRVILGTVAVHNPTLVQQVIQRFGAERIVVGIDARDNRVAIRGWTESASITVLDLARQMKNCGVKRIIYTDIDRDGMLTGPNGQVTGQLAQATGLRIIASGGVGSIADILRLAQLEPLGVEGVIVGKALYEGKFRLPEVYQKLAARRPVTGSEVP